MDKVLERLKEPSSYASLAGIIYGVGEIFKIREAPVIAETVGQAGQAVSASGGDWTAAIGITIAGILGFFMRERGSEK